MNISELKELWQSEQNYAFKGWDFSHISGRWEGENLHWDYEEIVLSYLNQNYNLLDMGTGGGEFLLTLNHPYHLTSVTESYPPNVELCKKTLSPLGITVKQVYEDSNLPFDNNTFDIIINRHESFDIKEVKRILKRGGLFITQQVGGKNDSELSNLLIDNFKPQFPDHDLKNNVNKFKNEKFDILKSEEEFTKICFFDVGALVYFAKIIEWEFPNFSVDSCFENLLKAHKIIEEQKQICGTEHRFLIVAKKQ